MNRLNADPVSAVEPGNLLDGADDVASGKPDQHIHDFFEERVRAGDGFAIAYDLESHRRPNQHGMHP
jgi:hypothetical protein